VLKRCRVPEIMDDPNLDENLHIEALAGLANLNSLSGSAAILWKEIERESADEPLSILDIATGSGDIPLALWRRSKTSKKELKISGCDISRRSVELANSAAQKLNADVNFFQMNALDGSIPSGFDVIVSSLFCHHLSDDEVVSLLKNMAQSAKRLVLVNDLERSPVNLGLVWLGSRILSRSPVVHFDGPASVRAAFRVDEIKDLAERAGLAGASVTHRFPSRFLLSWRKED